MSDTEYLRRLNAGIREFQVKVASPWKSPLTVELRQIYEVILAAEPAGLGRAEIAKALYPDWAEIDTYTWAMINRHLNSRLDYLGERGLVYPDGSYRNPYFTKSTRTSPNYRARPAGQADTWRAQRARRALYALVDHLNERLATSSDLIGRAYAYNERAGEILKLRTEGWTLARIGQHYGLTRERVRQILAKAYNDGYRLFEADTTAAA